jgi:hypothetical protein
VAWARKWFIPEVLRPKSDDELRAFLDEVRRLEETSDPESRSVHRDRRVAAERELRRRAKKAGR